MDTYCYQCGQEIHFDARIKSKNNKFIPLQGKRGTTLHDCPSNPFSNYARWQWKRNQRKKGKTTKTTTTTIPERIVQYLAIIGLPPFCRDLDEIRQAYRKVALVYHPDRSNSNTTAAKFIEIHRAYEKCLEELEA